VLQLLILLLFIVTVIVAVFAVVVNNDLKLSCKDLSIIKYPITSNCTKFCFNIDNTDEIMLR